MYALQLSPQIMHYHIFVGQTVEMPIFSSTEDTLPFMAVVKSKFVTSSGKIRLMEGQKEQALIRRVRGV